MIPLFTVSLPPASELMPEVTKTLYSGYIGQGQKVEEFEEQLKGYYENRNVLTVNSGTSALQLALRLANVDGGEVITTPMTCTATNMPILAERATIVWADVDGLTGLIDPVDVERKITNRTRAIMAVHWGGTPCNMAALWRIGIKYGIPIVEDAAHAMGALYGGRRVGSDSDYAAFSLQAIKHITTVDGGILTMRDGEAYKRGKLLRWYGIDRETERKDFRCEEDILEWGYKFHMNDVTATIGLVQLRHLGAIVSAHRANATYFDGALSSYFGRAARGNSTSAYWLYTILLPDKDERLAFMAWMKERDVMVSQVHARNDGHTTFQPYRQHPLPGVDEFTDRMVCIPVHSKLLSLEKQRIADACNQFAKSR